MECYCHVKRLKHHILYSLFNGKSKKGSYCCNRALEYAVEIAGRWMGVGNRRGAGKGEEGGGKRKEEKGDKKRGDRNIIGFLTFCN